ncbi:hypothetical protein IWW36_000949 [Coemansia brasiliensis]|uniref:UBX domain-containing protein n=1 Tax=Coemansia brasiliensis TaxID=2650707 RepID=A0A9W8M1A0_9FUNG|nr:hypothetical protein IWW36_000949 [Coemansia brasiliensis]
MSDKEQLLEFGFSEALVEQALQATNNAGLNQALDWINNHQDAPTEETPNSGTADQASDVAEAQSLVCNDCGKQFKNEDLAQYHAVKSGHTNFAQSTEAVKPLSEEEKKQKLAELQERIAEKRRKREKEEKEEQRQNELLRRKAGKDLSEQQERLKEEQMKREFEKQKRMKEEDKRAAQRIKEQIEQDKRDRAARLAQEKAEREGQVVAAGDKEPQLPSLLEKGLPKISTSATQTRLQIRPMGQVKGSPRPLTGVFEVDQTLKDVIKFIRQELPGIGHHAKLSTTFPRKDFGSHDEAKTLKELGLVPNAALILTE